MGWITAGRIVASVQHARLAWRGFSARYQKSNPMREMMLSATPEPSISERILVQFPSPAVIRIADFDISPKPRLVLGGDIFSHQRHLQCPGRGSDCWHSRDPISCVIVSRRTAKSAQALIAQCLGADHGSRGPLLLRIALEHYSLQGICRTPLPAALTARLDFSQFATLKTNQERDRPARALPTGSTPARLIPPSWVCGLSGCHSSSGDRRRINRRICQ
jgi:hypothetical protein